MSACGRYEICGFLNSHRKDMPALVEILSRRLCKGNYSECAIYYIYRYLEDNDESNINSIERKLNDIEESLMPFELSKAKKMLIMDKSH